jgi:hypothetical protein
MKKFARNWHLQSIQIQEALAQANKAVNDVL